MDAHAYKSGRPKAAELDAQYLCVGDRSLPELGVHSLGWPCELYANGRPIRNVADHPDLWVPIVARGHAKRNAWTRVDADGRPYLCVGARMEMAKKIPTPLRGVRLTNFVCRLFHFAEVLDEGRVSLTA